MGNPDRLLLEKFLSGGGKPLAFDSNPFSVSLGGMIEQLDGAVGTLAMSFTPAHQFIQGNGVLQGGIVSSMLDFVLGLCVVPMLPPNMTAATASLTVSFMRGALPGKFVATGHVDKLGKRTAFTRGTLTDEFGNLVASGVSVLSVIPEPALRAK